MIERIFLTHLIIIIKSEVSPFPIVVIFSHGCVPEVVIASYAVGFIHILGKLGLVSFYYCAVLWCVQITEYIDFDMMVIFICLHITLPHYDHYADQSQLIELLKCLSGTFCLECVSKIKAILSIIFHSIYGAVLTHFSCDDCENMCTFSLYLHQIASMTHLPLFRVRSWNNGMRCMSFHILLYRNKHLWIKNASLCGNNTLSSNQDSATHMKIGHSDEIYGSAIFNLWALNLLIYVCPIFYSMGGQSSNRALTY